MAKIFDIDSFLETTKILIFGSYHPNNKPILDKLIEFLKRRGFINTSLAAIPIKDFNESSYEKKMGEVLSRIEKKMINAHFNIFIFFSEKNESTIVELTCLVKYTTEKSKISPLYYDFYTDLDNKHKEINKIYVKFEEWLTSSDINEKQKVDKFIEYLHCFASHMRCQLNQMYSGWYQKELPSIIIPKYCKDCIDVIKKTITEYENEGRSKIYEKLGIRHL